MLREMLHSLFKSLPPSTLLRPLRFHQRVQQGRELCQQVRHLRDPLEQMKVTIRNLKFPSQKRYFLNLMTNNLVNRKKALIGPTGTLDAHSAS